MQSSIVREAIQKGQWFQGSGGAIFSGDFGTGLIADFGDQVGVGWATAAITLLAEKLLEELTVETATQTAVGVGVQNLGGANLEAHDDVILEVALFDQMEGLGAS
jgi:hypothetical protein